MEKVWWLWSRGYRRKVAQSRYTAERWVTWHRTAGSDTSGPQALWRVADSCNCKGWGTEVASALLGTALFLGQTLKTQGRSGSAWELAQVSEGRLTDNDPSTWTVQNIQPEHSILSTCTSSCCHRPAQTAPEMRAAKRGIPGMRPTPSAMELILSMGHVLLFQYFWHFTLFDVAKSRNP